MDGPFFAVRTKDAYYVFVEYRQQARNRRRSVQVKPRQRRNKVVRIKHGFYTGRTGGGDFFSPDGTFPLDGFVSLHIEVR
jgi:hypothetical protein